VTTLSVTAELPVDLTAVVPGASGAGRPGALPPAPLLALLDATAHARDGVWYVGRLLEEALAELYGAAVPRVSLDPRTLFNATVAERASFVGRLVLAQLRTDGRWVLFNHMGLARAETAVPRPLRRPYALFLHGVEVWDATLSGSRRELVSRAALRLANSRYTAERAMRAHPDVGRVVPCPLGLLRDGAESAPDHALEAATRRRVGEAAVLIVGRMWSVERYKGHDELLESWPAVRARVPGARLVVVGSGDDMARLQAKARTIGAADAVDFLGKVSDQELSALRRCCALFAMPSRGEGFGLVYLEAMRAGLACVASREDAAGEIVADGETGMLVRQSDGGALAGAIAALLLDPERRRRMGEAGRRRYEREFTFDAFRERLRRILVDAAGDLAPAAGGRAGRAE